MNLWITGFLISRSHRVEERASRGIWPLSSCAMSTSLLAVIIMLWCKIRTNFNTIVIINLFYPLCQVEKKVNGGKRTFNYILEFDFFAPLKRKMVCLLCDTILNILKKANYKEKNQFSQNRTKNFKKHQDQMYFSVFVKKNTYIKKKQIV